MLLRHQGASCQPQEFFFLNGEKLEYSVTKIQIVQKSRQWKVGVPPHSSIFLSHLPKTLCVCKTKRQRERDRENQNVPSSTSHWEKKQIQCLTNPIHGLFSLNIQIRNHSKSIHTYHLFSSKWLHVLHHYTNMSQGRIPIMYVQVVSSFTLFQ